MLPLIKKANTILGYVYREKNFNCTSAPGNGMTAATLKSSEYNSGLMLQLGESSKNCQEND